jgi:hypothetical protein
MAAMPSNSAEWEISSIIHSDDAVVSDEQYNDCSMDEECALIMQSEEDGYTSTSEVYSRMRKSLYQTFSSLFAKNRLQTPCIFLNLAGKFNRGHHVEFEADRSNRFSALSDDDADDEESDSRAASALEGYDCSMDQQWAQKNQSEEDESGNLQAINRMINRVLFGHP